MWLLYYRLVFAWIITIVQLLNLAIVCKILIFHPKFISTVKYRKFSFQSLLPNVHNRLWTLAFTYLVRECTYLHRTTMCGTHIIHVASLIKSRPPPKVAQYTAQCIAYTYFVMQKYTGVY